MLKKISYVYVILLSLLLSGVYDNLAQAIPAKIKHPIYFGLQFGYSSVFYNNSILTGGVTATHIDNSGISERLMLGYNFNRYIATEMSMIYFFKPTFHNINGTNFSRKIKNNFFSVVAKLSWPLYKRLSVNGKIGIGYIARNGIKINGVEALKEHEYFTPAYGAGVVVYINPRFSVDVTWMQAPANANNQLPVSNFYGIGGYVKFSWG